MSSPIVIITGAGGMLGSALLRYLESTDYEYKGLTHADLDITCTNCVEKAISPDDTVINAAGIGPRTKHTQDEMTAVNAIGPHILAARCSRLIQVSTDCVFNGTDNGIGPYSEASAPSPTDWYGLTKLAGEIDYGVHLTVRCSFVGLTGGLLGWLYNQPKDADIDGWTNAVWNGFHVDDMARRLILMAKLPLVGIVHEAGETWSKYELLSDVMLGDLRDRGIIVTGKDEPVIDRRLTSARVSHIPYSHERLLASVMVEHERLQETKA